MKWVVLFCLAIVFFPEGNADTRPLSMDSPGFREAVQAYDAANYKEAITRLGALLKEGGENAEIRYNLGDAYFRNKELGQSIFHFRKALELLPRDPDVRFNLGYVRKHAADKIEEKSSVRGIISIFPLSQKESFYFLAFASLLFWGTGLVALFRKEKYWKQAQFVFFVIFLLSIGVFAELKLGKRPFGVVVSSAAEVYSGIGKDNVLLFTLHEGAEFTVGESGGDDWVQISLADGKKGWVRKRDVIL